VNTAVSDISRQKEQNSEESKKRKVYEGNILPTFELSSGHKGETVEQTREIIILQK
jgi:hypothetical protein